MAELPPNSAVTSIEFEGPEVAVYSENPKILVEDDMLVRKLARKIRKRIVIRSDPKRRMAKDETIFYIKNLIGEESEITSLDFDDNLGEVIIDADKPGVIIGKSGETLRKIISKTLWRPKVQRTPPIASKVIKTVRHVLQEETKRRQEILRLIGKRIHRPLIYRNDTIRVTGLGGFGEVGRSSALVQTGESSVLVDCGISVGAQSPQNIFPRFDLPEFDIEELDAVIISHAHLDHCLPPDTPVSLANGLHKKIKDIEVGDELLSFNWQTGKYDKGVCISKTFTRGHKKIVKIKTPFMEISSSPNHRFFIIEELKVKEIEASDLRVGLILPLIKPSNKSNPENGRNRLLPISVRDVVNIFTGTGIIRNKYSETEIKEVICNILPLDDIKGDYISEVTAHDLIKILRERANYLEDLSLLSNNLGKFVPQIAQIFDNGLYEQIGYNLVSEGEIKQETQEFLEEQITKVLYLIRSYISKIQYVLDLNVEWQLIEHISIHPNSEELIDIEVTPFHNFIAKNFIVHNSGFVPYLFKYGFKGPVYSTKPTRDLMTMLQIDYLDVAEKEGKLLPYSQRDIREALLHTIVLDYNEVTDIAPDIRLTFYQAGHIVGSAIPHLHIGEGVYNIAFAQDIKFARSKLLDPAVSHFPRLETLFIESTYGNPTDVLPPRSECEKQLENIINETIKRNGKILIPVLAVGRAQEIILVLEELMRNNKIPKVPVYTDGMIREATAIVSAHPEALSKSVRDRIFHEGENPFLSEQFIHVSSQEERERIIMGDSAIILATSGMLNGGPSVFYFKNLCEDKNNSMIFVSYQGKGTLGSRIQKGITEVQMFEDRKTVMYHIAMSIHSISGFTGHSDRRELEAYIRKVTPKPERIVFIHGDSSKSTKLASWAYKTVRKASSAPPIGTTIRVH